jgi:hypothetical protein
MSTRIGRKAMLRGGLVGLVTAVAFATFLLIQWNLSIDGRTYFEGTHPRLVTDLAAVRYDLWLAVLRFSAASLAMAALIFGGRRRFTFAIPIVMALALPAVFGGVPDCTSFGQTALPHAVGPGWSHMAFFDGCGYAFFSTWLGAAIDLVLVAVPAIVLASVTARSRRGAVTANRAQPSVGSSLVAAMLCLIGFGLLVSAREMGLLGGYPLHWSAWLPIHLSLAAFGAMLGMRRSWWSVALIVVPLAFYPLEAGLPYGFEFDLPLAAYPVLVTVLAACWLPLAIGVEKGRFLLAGIRGYEPGALAPSAE